MDTIQDNIPIEIFVSDISDTESYKPVEKPKRKREPNSRKNNTEATAWRKET
jgi:hypothetical protein